MSQASEVNQHYEKERRHSHHQQNLAQKGKDGTEAEVLRALSEVTDLPIDPGDDAIMGQLVSELSSTANLTAEAVRSNEWVREYIMILYLCRYPREEGCHGSWRGWSHNDADAAIEPMAPEKRMEIEAFVTNSKLALSRSEDAKVIEESVRNVNESIVNEESGEGGSSSGLLGVLKR